jgi:hypothetical protein
MTSTADRELILHRLANGDADPVLAADFQAFSAAPRLSRLLGDRARDRPVYQVDPLPVLSRDRAYIPVPELAARCVDAFTAADATARHTWIVSYCGAAALALHIAKLLGNSRRVSTLLVQPTWLGDTHIEAQFASCQAALGAAERRRPDLDGDPGRRIAELERILRDDLAALAARQGLDASTEAFAELLVSYQAWLAFMLASRNATPVGWAGRSDALTVVTDTPAGAGVPGLNPRDFRVDTLSLRGRADVATPELADQLLARL